ncbi:ATP-binding protein [Candidatus Saccharibacteria bacterium]|nr:ATP-binding protein [Candidatus Saccharibacteria bacterium]
MVRRPLYLNKLISYIDKPFIKILAGIRRSGKSSLLEQVKDELLSRGTPVDKIALINFDSIDYTHIRTKPDLVALEKSLLDRGVHYFLLDEVQNIEQWDEAISALYAEKNTDIFITGSNSKLLSSELSTFFTGRYVDLKIHTLNFSETLDFKRALNQPIKSIPEEFSSYLARGGFPSLYVSIQTEQQDDSEITDIYNSILYKDLVERKNIRNTELLSRVTRFVMDSIGSPISAKSISDYLKNEKISLSQDTIYKYLDWLEEAMIIEKVRRYDLRGKELLKTQEKYYLADIGLLYAINGRSSTYLSGVLENLVYHELVSHGYQVYIGKNDSQEIDFIAERNHQKIYLQVAAHISDKSTVEREFGALRNIQDNFPKYVLTLDQDFLHSEDGIEAKYLPEIILGL